MKQYSSVKSVINDMIKNSNNSGIYTGKVTKEKPKLEIDVFEAEMTLYKTDIIVPKMKVKIDGGKSEIEYDLEVDDIVYLIRHDKRYMIIGNKDEDDEDGDE